MTPHLHRLSGFSFFFMISGSADRLPRLSRIPVMANHCSGPLHLRFHWRKQLLSGPMEQQKAGQLEGSLQVSNQIPLTCFFVNSQYFHDQPTKWVFSYGIYTCVSWRVFIYSILTIRWLRNFHVMGAPWFQDLGVAPNGNIPQIIDFSLSELEQAEYLWATLSKLQTTAEGYATHSTSPTQWKQHSFPTVPCFWIGSSTSQTSHRESGALTKSDLKHIVRLQEVQYNLGFSICWYTIYVDMILIYCIRYTYIYVCWYVLNHRTHMNTFIHSTCRPLATTASFYRCGIFHGWVFARGNNAFMQWDVVVVVASESNPKHGRSGPPSQRSKNKKGGLF